MDHFWPKLIQTKICIPHLFFLLPFEMFLVGIILAACVWEKRCGIELQLTWDGDSAWIKNNFSFYKPLRLEDHFLLQQNLWYRTQRLYVRFISLFACLLVSYQVTLTNSLSITSLAKEIDGMCVCEYIYFYIYICIYKSTMLQ